MLATVTDLIWNIVTGAMVGTWIGIMIVALIVQGTELRDAWRRKRAEKGAKAGQDGQRGAKGETKKAGGRDE
jgi:hypothetical protein